MIKIYAFLYWIFLSVKEKSQMLYETRNMTLREKLIYLRSIACEGEMDQASYVLKELCDKLLEGKIDEH